jgi:hypothetical protein
VSFYNRNFFTFIHENTEKLEICHTITFHPVNNEEGDNSDHKNNLGVHHSAGLQRSRTYVD